MCGANNESSFKPDLTKYPHATKDDIGGKKKGWLMRDKEKILCDTTTEDRMALNKILNPINENEGEK